MKFKVCGLKYPDNIRQIAELNPDYMGFIFYEGSKRFVGEEFVMPEIPANVKKVGVFVNASPDYILLKVNKYKLDYIQLHGTESAETCAELAKTVNVIKAFGVDENFDLSVLDAYKNFCSHFLFDTKTESFGGSGKPFNWDALSAYNYEQPFFIAGGMDIERLRMLQEKKLNVYGVDVNSKAEIKPGYKDIIKIIQLRNNIR